MGSVLHTDPKMQFLIAIPVLAIIMLSAMSVGVWLMSKGTRRLVGFILLSSLVVAWKFESWELFGGTLLASLIPTAFNAVIDGAAKKTIELDSTFQYWLNVLISLDQLANALLGGFPDETLSSVAYRMSVTKDSHWRWQVARSTIDSLFWFEEDHCHKAFLAEINRAQQDPELRKLAQLNFPGV